MWSVWHMSDSASSDGNGILLSRGRGPRWTAADDQRRVRPSLDFVVAIDIALGLAAATQDLRRFESPAGVALQGKSLLSCPNVRC